MAATISSLPLTAQHLKPFLQFADKRIILKNVLENYLTENYQRKLPTAKTREISKSLSTINFRASLSDLQDALFKFLSQFPNFNFEHIREIELLYVIHTANSSNSGWIGYSFDNEIFDDINEELNASTSNRPRRTKKTAPKKTTRNKVFNNTVLNEQLDFAWVNLSTEFYLEKNDAHGYNWFRLERANLDHQFNNNKRNPGNYFIADWENKHILFKISNSYEMNQVFNENMNLGLNLDYFKMKKARATKKADAPISMTGDETNLNISQSSVLTDRTNATINAGNMNVSKAFSHLQKKIKGPDVTETDLSQRLDASTVQNMLSPKKSRSKTKNKDKDKKEVKKETEEQKYSKRSKKYFKAIDNRMEVDLKNDKGLFRFQIRPVEEGKNLYQALDPRTLNSFNPDFLDYKRYKRADPHQSEYMKKNGKGHFYKVTVKL